jgi:hypothetical protein
LIAMLAEHLALLFILSLFKCQHISLHTRQAKRNTLYLSDK